MSLNSVPASLFVSEGGELDDSGDVPQDELLHEDVLQCDNGGTDGEAFELEPLLNLKTREMPLLLSVPLSAY